MTLLRLLVLKLVSLCLVGTCWAQNKTVEFSHAIARAEGFYQAGTLPARYHNPGDLKVRAGEKYPGQVGVGKAGHVIFRNNQCGWWALYHQVDKIMTGDSRFYTPQMTLTDVAHRYAGNWRRWAQNVAHNLGVPPSTTLQEFFDRPPQVTYGTPLRAFN